MMNNKEKMEREIVNQPDPFTTLVRLADEQGDTAVLLAFAMMTAYLMENDKESLRAVWLNMEITQLLGRYRLLFPDATEVAAVPLAHYEGGVVV